MRKRIIALLALLLAFTLTFTGCAALRNAVNLIMGWEDEEPADMPKFSEIEYVRPDLDRIETEFADTIAYLGKSDASMQQVRQKVSDCYDLYTDFYTMQNVAELRYYHDITDDFYAAESDWCMDQEARIDQLYDQLCVAGANSTAAEYLEKNFFGAGFIDAYGGDDGGTIDDGYVELANRENSILNEYRRTVADPTVTWEGKEQSYWDLLADPAITEADEEAINALYYDKYSQVLGEIYLRLVAVRQEFAAYLGFDSYEDYAYLAFYNRDYTPEQTADLLEEIQTELAPLYEELHVSERKEDHEYYQVSEREIYSALSAAITDMGDTVQNAYSDMVNYELSDFTISDNKGDVSYQTYLYAYDNPYIIVKTYGYDDDLLSAGHEFGHFVDAWYNYNGTDSIDLAEVFSQGMELLLLSRLPYKYRAGLTEYKLIDTLDTFTQQASFAAFEHEVYSRPAEEWTPDDLNELSLRVAEDYGYLIPGREDYYAKSWIDINHFFENPYYVISYVVSADAAFQIYEKECAAAGEGMALWNKMLPRDYDGFLDTLIQQGDMQDPFGAGRMAEIAALLRQKLN